MSDGKMQEMVRGMKSIDNMQLGCVSTMEQMDLFMAEFFPESQKSGIRWVVCNKCGYRAKDRFDLILHINNEWHIDKKKNKEKKTKEVDEGAQELSF